MKIEIASKEYWVKLNYYDGLLYCQLLNIDGKNDWRMAYNYDELDDMDNGTNDEIITRGVWIVLDNKRVSETRLARYVYWVVPVRDLG